MHTQGVVRLTPGKHTLGCINSESALSDTMLSAPSPLGSCALL